MSDLEAFHGLIRNIDDALLVIEAARVGLVPLVRKRLTAKQRSEIRSGSVFVWNEKGSGIKRWTDGKAWSASRINTVFLVYRELSKKVRYGGQDVEDFGGEVMEEGLIKKAVSISTVDDRDLHISDGTYPNMQERQQGPRYNRKSSNDSGLMSTPSASQIRGSSPQNAVAKSASFSVHPQFSLSNTPPSSLQPSPNPYSDTKSIFSVAFSSQSSYSTPVASPVIHPQSSNQSIPTLLATSQSVPQTPLPIPRLNDDMDIEMTTNLPSPFQKNRQTPGEFVPYPYYSPVDMTHVQQLDRCLSF
ncbi:Gti1/Pac2 family-domain-containing protein [Paraphysoderma sedebokerense]|nr:Gti1/Pac2 family-domain-containing protein [Paraphysoderma sedebokerense]